MESGKWVVDECYESAEKHSFTQLRTIPDWFEQAVWLSLNVKKYSFFTLTPSLSDISLQERVGNLCYAILVTISTDTF